MNTAQARQIGYQYAGPVFVDYVSWILNDAVKNNIKTLYFLARDGYALKKIADILCQRYSINIECRYLYCSRISLRIPSFHILGDEAYDLLCLSGYHVTPRTVLDRMLIDGDTANTVFSELGLQPDSVLTRDDLMLLKTKLKDCSAFNEAAFSISKKAYGMIMGYFHQEGLFDQNCVAIVDSGWTGSMQRSIRQLLKSGGYKGEILGYYFGLYPVIHSNEDGIYKTWYFNGRGRISDKILFCNNLLECMLTAPHGMTVGFRNEAEQIVPVFAEQDKNLALFAEQHISGMLEYAQNAEAECGTASSKCSQKMRRFIHDIMTSPTIELVECYGQIPFCDDLNEKCDNVLACKEQVDCLKNYLIFNRILARLSRKKKENCWLYWPFGTLAFVSPVKREWYKINLFLWEFMRCMHNR